MVEYKNITIPNFDHNAPFKIYCIGWSHSAGYNYFFDKKCWFLDQRSTVCSEWLLQKKTQVSEKLKTFCNLKNNVDLKCSQNLFFIYGANIWCSQIKYFNVWFLIQFYFQILPDRGKTKKRIHIMDFSDYDLIQKYKDPKFWSECVI